jgi:hypothetical protein
MSGVSVADHAICNLIRGEASMKSIEQVGSFRRAKAPCAKAPAGVRRSPAVAMELRLLRLAAEAAGIRQDIGPHELAKYPELAAALEACEALFKSMGWGDTTLETE